VHPNGYRMNLHGGEYTHFIFFWLENSNTMKFHFQWIPSSHWIAISSKLNYVEVITFATQYYQQYHDYVEHAIYIFTLIASA
jgi:hypothetical protein